MKVLKIRLNRFELFGRVRDINLEYKPKGGTNETLAVCEVELEAPYNGTPDIIKMTAFYDAAEKIAGSVEKGDWVVARGRIRGTKSGNNFSMNLWANSVEKAQEEEV